MRKRKLKVIIALCTALTLVNTTAVLNIPENVVITEASISGTYNDFNYYLFDNNELSITGYNGSDVNVKVPSYIQVGNTNYKVTSIGSNAFYGNSKVESIKLPETLKNIGDYSFYGCSKLKDINIPSNVSSTGAYSFYSCTSLESIKLPDGLISIGTYAFNSCTNLKEIFLPASLNTLGDNPFINCNNLININVDENNTVFKSVDGILYNKNLSTLIACPASREELKVIDGVTSLGRLSCYTCKNLKKAILPETITNIQESSFNSCYSLKEINFPSNLTSIGNYSFYYCHSLNKVDLPFNITSMGDNCFFNCTALESITLPEKLSSIGSTAFDSCVKLTKILLPASLKTMGYNPFINCSSLTDINISEDNNVFRSVAGVLYNKNLSSLIICPAGRTELKVLDGVTSLSNRACSTCKKLNKVSLPNTLTLICEYAFYGCSSLEKIKLPECLTQIQQGTFYGCSSLKSIEIPNSVSSIGVNTFYGCSSLIDVIYPYRNGAENGVLPSGYSYDYIDYLRNGNYCETHLLKRGNKLPLEKEDSMYYINGSNNITPTSSTTYYFTKKQLSLSDYSIKKTTANSEYSSDVSIVPTRSGCNLSFDNINYSDKLEIKEDINEKKTLYLKNTDNTISKGYVNLENIKIDDTIPTLDIQGDFENTAESIDLTLNKTYGKSGAVVTISKDGEEEEVLTDDNYTIYNNGTYTFKITSGSGVVTSKTIEVNNISNDKNFVLQYNEENKTAAITKYTGKDMNISIPNVVLKDGSIYVIKEIKHHAFSNCNFLKSINIPSGITDIDDYAFYNCKNLKSADLSSNLNKIGSYAFYNCTNLKNIKIPYSVTEIGDYAFLKCTSLKEVKISALIKSIGNSAFAKCTDLNKIEIGKSSIDRGRLPLYSCNNITNAILRNTDNYDLLVKSGINLDDYYIINLEQGNYNEVQLVKKGSALVVDSDDSYYNLYDGDNLLTDYIMNKNAKYKILTKTITDIDYTIDGSKGEKEWFNSAAAILPSDKDSQISVDGKQWSSSIVVSETLKSDKCIYIKDALGVVSKGKIPKDKIKIDSQKPKIEASGDFSKVTDKVKLSINTFCGESGLEKVTVSKDGGEEEEVTDDIYSVDSNGKYTFKVTSGSGLTASTEIEVNNIYKYEDFEYDYDEENKEAIITGYCGEDEEIYVPSKVKKDDVEYKIEEVYDWAFADNEKTAKVELPDSINKIGDSAFSGCSNLKELNIPSNIESISAMMLNNCTSLEKITIPEGITSIEDCAFLGCSSLTEIAMPETVKSVSSMAFAECASLNKVVFSSNLTYLGDCVFDNSEALKTIIFKSGNEDIVSEELLKDYDITSSIYDNKLSLILNKK